MKTSEFVKRKLAVEIDPAFSLRASFIVDHVIANNPKTILDVGCGRGFYLKIFSLLDGPNTIIGIDKNREYLSQARSLTRQDKRVKIKRGSIYKLPFLDGSFDIVVCSEVLEHLTDEKTALKELYRVTKPDGMLLITVPNSNFPFLWDPINWVLIHTLNTHINKNTWWLAGIWADHERLYSRKDIERVVSWVGFEIANTKEFIHWCWPGSHFLLYGLGKNIVEHLGVTPLNRFNFKSTGTLSRLFSQFFSFPSRLLDKRFPTKASMNICLVARKAPKARNKKSNKNQLFKPTNR